MKLMLTFYDKYDMLFKDYQWTTYPNNDPRITGNPDCTLFNRHEGLEVLYLINCVAEKHDFKKKASAGKLEIMIKQYLPPNVRMQEKVMKWLIDNWDKY